MTHKRAMSRLTSDLKAVIRDAEEVLAATAGQAGEHLDEMRDHLSALAESARSGYEKLGQMTVSTARATDRCIRDHPYETISVAFALGLLLGVLFRRD